MPRAHRALARGQRIRDHGLLASYDTLSALLALCQKYGGGRVEAICQSALAFHVVSVPRIAGMLKSAAKPISPSILERLVPQVLGGLRFPIGDVQCLNRSGDPLGWNRRSNVTAVPIASTVSGDGPRCCQPGASDTGCTPLTRASHASAASPRFDSERLPHRVRVARVDR